MPWLKVDDKFHAHHKPRMAGKAAVGVWVLAGSWCMDNPKYDGFVPASVARQWGTPADAAKLVRAGLWFADEREGEKGWRFNDWHIYNPDYASIMAAQNATSQAKSVGGQLGNHNRWHKGKGVSVPTCEFCSTLTEPDFGSDEGSHTDRIPIAPASHSDRPVPEPDPLPTSKEVRTPPNREDVERICIYLADAVEKNGSKRPAITKTWRDEARRLIDLDKRTEDEVLRAIDWCQRGESTNARFWRSNVMSLPKLRQKFDQMRLQAAQEGPQHTPGTPPPTVPLPSHWGTYD